MLILKKKSRQQQDFVLIIAYSNRTNKIAIAQFLLVVVVFDVPASETGA